MDGLLLNTEDIYTLCANNVLAKHRWLSESLIRRIYVAYRGLNEWDVGNEEVQQKIVDEVLQLIEDRGSKIRDKWDNDIKALRRPDLESTGAGADSLTLVDL
jgi:hypothetical protein